MRIYTRTGDDGTTSLWRETGQPRRVPKDAVRVEAYGTIDEANSILGLAKALLPDGSADVYAQLDTIQQDLFRVGSDLATPDLTPQHRRISEVDVGRLEAWIDAADASLPRLRRFILPDGTPAGSALHVARTVVRRAERHVVRLARETGEGEAVPYAELVRYLNRLSDLLFMLARRVNAAAGRPETEVRPDRTGEGSEPT